MATRMNNLTGKEWLQNSFSIWRDVRKTKEESQLKHPAMYPAQLAERLINIYTKDPEEVILDPFLGIGSTLMGAKLANRKGIGIDLNPDYCKISQERLQDCPQFKIICGDSKKVLTTLDSNSVDFCLNSPPYWDILNQKRSVDQKEIRNYSNQTKDLGNISDYQQFLNGLKEIYKEVYRVLKPNKRCCCVVMDIRKKDKFYPLHLDLSLLMKEIGFELEEFVIWDRQHEYNNMKTLGYPYVFRFNKVHEFICVFWKR